MPVQALLLLVLFAQAAPKDKLACLLARPLVVGASMSAQHLAPDPGTLLARDHGSQKAVTRRAFSHQPSTVILPSVGDQDLAGASLVFALDLFFWDSKAGECRAAVQRVEEFAQRVRAARRPIVIGNIPPKGAPCDAVVSQRIESLCAAMPAQCVVSDLRGLAEAAERDGSVLVNGVPVSKAELYPDGLHPSELGSRLLANGIEASLRASAIACSR